MMRKNNPIRIGTRGSLLARVQTEWVMDQLRRREPDRHFEIMTITTRGDAILDRSLSRVGGKGLFTEELEQAIRDRRIDLAVHSLKDLPTQLPAGLAVGAIPPREDPRDALVGIDRATLQNPPRPIRVGTSSLRRVAQLRRRFPSVEVVNLRGNVDTRLRKVKDGVVDATVLAMAGLCRLGRTNEVNHVFDDEEILPAPGQGALAVEIRADDDATRNLLDSIHCTGTADAVMAERSLLHVLEGGCQVPVGAHARITDGVLTLRGNVISLDGSRCIEVTCRGEPRRAEAIGREAAEKLLAQGAGAIIEEIRQHEADGGDE